MDIEMAPINRLEAAIFRLFLIPPGRHGIYRPRVATLLLASFIGGVIGAICFGQLMHFPLWVVAIGTVGLMIAAPRMLAKFERGRANARFVEAFPDAIDMIVRMVRAGLPASAAIQTVGKEASEPIGGVFREIANEAAIGVPLENILARRVEDIGLAEFRYFTVAVTLQRSTGGNLAETLDLLSDIIRRRRNMRLKARAMMSEVKASAWVLGALPFVIGSLLVIVNPGYVSILFTDPRGHVVLGAIVAFLTTAVLTMRWLIGRTLKV